MKKNSNPKDSNRKLLTYQQVSVSLPQILTGASIWRRLGWARKISFEDTHSCRTSGSESCTCFDPFPAAAFGAMSLAMMPSNKASSIAIPRSSPCSPLHAQGKTNPRTSWFPSRVAERWNGSVVGAPSQYLYSRLWGRRIKEKSVDDFAFQPSYKL